MRTSSILSICLYSILIALSNLSIQSVSAQGLYNYSILHVFKDGIINNEGGRPNRSLTYSTDGYLYGVAITYGSAGCGSIFKISPKGAITVLHNFGDGTVINDGYLPESSIFEGKDGNFYGTTLSGGSKNKGTIYKITPNGIVTILHSFCDGTVQNDGYYPIDGLIQASDGALYGMTDQGGSTTTINGQGYGTIYKLTSSGEYTILHNFGDGSTVNDGIYPKCSLVEGKDGAIYGVTQDGGLYGNGVAFKITKSGDYTLLHTFSNYFTNEGTKPHSTLVMDGSGNFYGTTFSGGTVDKGTVFKMTPDGIVTVLHSFSDGSIQNDGYWPLSGLTIASNGVLYGTSLYGGTKGYGVVFKITTSGTMQILHNFHDGSVLNDGATPYSPPVLDADGALYGTTDEGGVDYFYSYPRGYGTIYKIIPYTNEIPPVINSITPNSYSVGDADKIITLTGTGFDPAATVSIDGTPITVNSNNGTTITVTIPSAYLKKVVSYAIAVNNPKLSSKAVKFSGDITPPVTTAFLSGTNGLNGWYTSNVTATLSATDNLSIVAGTYYSLDNGTPTSYTSAISVNGDGIHSITFYSIDNLGNEETPKTISINIDATQPSLSFDIQSPPANSAGWNNTTVSIPYTISDTTSGIFSASPKSPIQINQEGKDQSISIIVTDKAGNSKTFKTPIVNNDFTAPVTTLSGVTDGLSVKDIASITISAIDNLSGINNTYYKIDNGPQQTYSTPFNIATPGTHTINYWSVDSAGNIEQANSTTFTILISPIITTLSPSTVSGSKSFTLTVNGVNFVSGSTIQWNGTSIPTTYVSATQLTASVDASYTTLSSYPGSATISVLNPDKTQSASATLAITAPVPTITSLSPASATVATSFTITVNGTNFVSGSVVKWNDTDLTTTYVSPSKLTADVPVSLNSVLSSYPGSAAIKVTNPSGETSNSVNITITEPLPVITSVSPDPVSANTGFTITVNGNYFTSGSKIQWNGTVLTTAYASAHKLTATVTKSMNPKLSAYPGTCPVVIVNPSGTSSAEYNVTISAPIIHTYGTGIQMISAPYDYSGQSMSAICDNPSLTLVGWNASTLSYIRTPNAPADTFHAGKGYWAIITTTTNLRDSGIHANASTPFTISLSTGWNMIGSPRETSIALTSATIRDKNGVSYTMGNALSKRLVYGVLYTFPAGRSNYTTITAALGSLAPYAGYWIYAYQPCTLVL